MEGLDLIMSASRLLNQDGMVRKVVPMLRAKATRVSRNRARLVAALALILRYAVTLYRSVNSATFELSLSRARSLSSEENDEEKEKPISEKMKDE
jgi:hypothetical protein